MRKFIPTIAILIAAAFSSCQKVIDVDLNSADPMYVIEGIVIEGNNTHYVQITRSLNFDQEAPFPAVNDAVVTIADDAGNTQVLSLAGDGIYIANNFPAVSGRTYTLTVSAGGNTFTASSTMPQAVALDTILATNYIFGDTIRTVTPVFSDPAVIANYYQYKFYINSSYHPDILLQDDQFIDGNVNQQPLFAGDLLAHDTVTIELLGIDKPVYKYFFALQQNSSTTPANPDSNFGKSCLGYFSARTRSVKTIVIPE
jgi:hypothetical protein